MRAERILSRWLEPLGIVPHRVEFRDGSSEWIGNLRDLHCLINVGVKLGVIAA